MATTKKDPVLVILQLTGANDYLNTIVPYTNGLYWDNRPKVNIPEHLVVPIDDELAFRSDMDSFKDLYDQGKLAIINGIGFEDSPRSHFRAMDIWHTCEPDKIGIDGDVGNLSDKVLRQAGERLKRWQFHPNGTEGFAKAEVTVGGIATSELSSKTMEAKRVPGLHAIGEAVDVTGWLGGYNFQWAWASGVAAGDALPATRTSS